jgi:hypothetical protein
VPTEYEVVADLVWLRALLQSGRALELLKATGGTSVGVAKRIGVSQPTAWGYLHGQHFPRRETALKLVLLFRELALIQRAAEDFRR